MFTEVESMNLREFEGIESDSKLPLPFMSQRRYHQGCMCIPASDYSNAQVTSNIKLHFRLQAMGSVQAALAPADLVSGLRNF
jgi:hypothetical protein